MKNVKEKNSNSDKKILQAIDHLAMITKRGFDSMVSKDEFNEFRDKMDLFEKETTKNFFNLDSKVEGIDKRLKRVEETLEPLFMGYKIMQKEIRELNSRMDKVERKAGIAK